MLVKLIGVPSLSALKFRFLAAELGLTYVLVKDSIPSAASKRFSIIKHKAETFLSDIKVAFCTSAEAYTYVSRRLAQAKIPYVVFICDNPVMLQEHGVFLLNTFQTESSVYTTVSVTKHDLLSSILAAQDLYLNAVPFDAPFDIKPLHTQAYAILTDIIAVSALHLIQPLFYGIKDHASRKQVQDSVFLYLAGVESHIGKAGEFSRIVENLVSDKIQRLRSACIYARGTSIDAAVERFRVDRFEINYVLSRMVLTAKERAAKSN